MASLGIYCCLATKKPDPLYDGYSGMENYGKGKRKRGKGQGKGKMGKTMKVEWDFCTMPYVLGVFFCKVGNLIFFKSKIEH